MRLSMASGALFAAATALDMSTQGIENLARRRLPEYASKFRFSLVNPTQDWGVNDSYNVSSTHDGRLLVQGTTLSALSKGLYRYLSDVAKVDFYWFIGNRLNVTSSFPCLVSPLVGSSIVPWRYHFNTVTFSYTTAFWSWEDWEEQLDWMSLHGINLALAWVGVEKIMVDVFREIGLTEDEISSFLSGPAFQSWNRLGNIQGSWGGRLPSSWIDGQFELQRKIVARMVELGMTPILPAFTGFVPRAITRVLPNATVVNGSQWSGFESQYTNVTFLEPSDNNFAVLQERFIAKQKDAYGNITTFYTLDRYNENDPLSGDLDYLQNASQGIWHSLKAADPPAVWVMQAWLFSYNSEFWTNDRIEAYLSGVEDDTGMLVLDLFSESSPQWQGTNSYYGKPWVWCQLHNFGGNMGMYGQIANITEDPVLALENSSSLVGFGLTMEGQEGNEIVYDLLLDQAWSSTPIDTQLYFFNWVTRRYAGAQDIPKQLYQAWEVLRYDVYNNTDLSTEAVPKSILELAPSTSGLVNRTGYHATNITYDPSAVINAWELMYHAARTEASLWSNPSFQYDMVDVTRQLLSNAFVPLYNNLVTAYNRPYANTTNIETSGKRLINLLEILDSVLSTNKHFMLCPWIESAVSWLPGNNDTVKQFFEYSARNQITLWGPRGEISDYASKTWGGLVSLYYIPRWSRFVEYLKATPASSYIEAALNHDLLAFELEWQDYRLNDSICQTEDLRGILEKIPCFISSQA